MVESVLESRQPSMMQANLKATPVWTAMLERVGAENGPLALLSDWHLVTGTPPEAAAS
jgi:hypothetical protein